MKIICSFALVFASLSALTTAKGPVKCTLAPYDFTRNWIDMVDPCIQKMRAQVKEELTAAVTYLAMGAHFARDTVNRPGFAKMFFEAASEEREHAIKIMSYLLMRGELTRNIHDLINEPIDFNYSEASWKDGVSALKSALELEIHVTKKIREIIETCEHTPTKTAGVVYNHYHLVDYLTGEFLEEQLKGERDIAGKISTLGKMMGSHAQLGEFLFDKKLLNGEL